MFLSQTPGLFRQKPRGPKSQNPKLPTPKSQNLNFPPRKPPQSLGNDHFPGALPPALLLLLVPPAAVGHVVPQARDGVVLLVPVIHLVHRAVRRAVVAGAVVPDPGKGGEIHRKTGFWGEILEKRGKTGGKSAGNGGKRVGSQREMGKNGWEIHGEQVFGRESWKSGEKWWKILGKLRKPGGKSTEDGEKRAENHRKRGLFEETGES